MNRSRIWPVLVATALVHAPMAQADARMAQANARMIAVSNCSGGMSLLVIPGEDGAPGKSGGDCAKACHGMCERRGKNAGKRDDPAR